MIPFASQPIHRPAPRIWPLLLMLVLCGLNLACALQAGIGQSAARETAIARLATDQAVLVARQSQIAQEQAAVQQTRAAAELQAAQQSGQQTLIAAQQSVTTAAAATVEARNAGAATIQAIQQATLDAFSAWLTPLGISSHPELVHVLSDGTLRMVDRQLISDEQVGKDLKNFLIEATFANPCSITRHSWDYGFSFRSTGPNSQYRLVVFSDKSWELTANVNTPDGALVTKGKLRNLKTGEGDTNDLRLVVYDKQAWFYLNGELVSTLTLADLTQPGDVSVGTTYYMRSYFEGGKTDYQNVYLWELP